jgi:hypothetical protein
MMLDCTTCKWIRWSASIPLILLLSAGGFVVFARLAEVRDDAPAALLGLYLATWSYVLAVAGVTLLSGWWLWKWLHMRFGHVESLPGEGGTKGAAKDFMDFLDDSLMDTA